MEEKNNKSNYKDCVFVTINTYKEKPEVKQESSDSSGFLGGYEVFLFIVFEHIFDYILELTFNWVGFTIFPHIVNFLIINIPLEYLAILHNLIV
ncbi:hypothetical protein AMS58_20745 [Pseudoalteromonas porphyrae]|uniref:Uncharacterized protein n=1 Tax=Pseudoalteromonas neustonica TaxID=1840331 RepID=A0ABU9U0K0_9GAMM|nr:MULTISPECIES: hypothetical protein [Pseudoalteromonas]KPH92828.1 hypothetical protein AMS58_20745 [Pseudoalteromonas porphyrae]NMR27252.1 hypothetical protein [Pseudoalteromonas sp. NEC-BIFX-2020_015]